jgi:hypothetical protein
MTPLPTSDHASAASICCSIFEAELVPRLGHNHKRPDKKLTPSEHSRITLSFFLAWRLLLETQRKPSDLQAKVADCTPVDILHVRELALFMINNIGAEQHVEIAGLMGYSEDGDVVERFLGLLEAAGACYEAVGMAGIHQPDFAPLGLGLLFDDWQESYVEPQVAQYERYKT